MNLKYIQNTTYILEEQHVLHVLLLVKLVEIDFKEDYIFDLYMNDNSSLEK